MPKIVTTFRGLKLEQQLTDSTTVGLVKDNAARHADPSLNLSAADVRLMYKGKLLKDDQQNLHELLVVNASSKQPKPQNIYRLMATGVSQTESAQAEASLRDGLEAAPRIRDDLTEKGKQDLERRRRLGRQMMRKAGRTGGGVSSQGDYGFGQIETLPNLPRRDEAQRLLESLAKDPGVLACMAKHKWKVGSLAELYPEGKVGESEVCVMGLNENKGMRILLRLRTDDLKGFRKILSIRKVLFHELAHNVHSEHDGKFFQLMRQIETECNEMDWTKGAGLTEMVENDSDPAFKGGAFRLGSGGNDGSNSNAINGTPTDAVSRRYLTAQAALRRMTPEEEQIENNCGCGHKNLFLPPEKDDAMEE